MNKELIDFCFRYETNIREAIESKRLDSCPPKTGGFAGNCRRSDPTCQIALRNICDVGTVVVEYGAAINGKREQRVLHKADTWLKVVDGTWRHFEGKQQSKIMTLRYKHSKGQEGVCKSLSISRSYYYVLLQDVYSFAERYAVGLGINTAKFKRNIGYI